MKKSLYLLSGFVLLAFTHLKGQSPIWSEDFANGIPSTWSNAGVNGIGVSLPNAVWEYRGPLTTPSNSTGSRGAFVGTLGPIQSPTASNGFVIFDSDYLDNNGLPSNFGNGIAPAPHKSSLITDTIDLTLHNSIEMRFSSYHRYYEGRVLLLFSTDGGLTYPDTIAVHPSISVNTSTPSNAVASYNVSSIIGGQSNVKIQFLFDGTFDDPGATGSGNGYYFWMIDDIELKAIPRHEMRFTEYNGAPEVDLIYGPAAASSKMGTMVLNFETDQTRDISSDANVYNFGSDTLRNIQLQMRVLNALNQVVSTFSSPVLGSLPPGDTADYNDLNTYASAWNPNLRDQYRLAFEVISDSTSVVFHDTIAININNQYMSNDNGVFSNQLGTPQIADDGCALASRLDFIQAATVERVRVGIGGSTRPGAVVVVEVYDSTGFDFLFGFPASSLKAASSSYTITAADSAAGFFEVPLTMPLQVPANSGYYFSIEMYSNSGADPITIRNDQTVLQSTLSAIMYFPSDNRWYSGYNNSRTLNSPWIRAVVRDSIAISASGPTDFCEGQSVTLSIPAGLDTYWWNTGDTVNTIQVDSSGTYFAAVSANGVTDTLSPVTVNVYPVPDNTVTFVYGDTAICQGDSVVLSTPLDPTHTYQWYVNGGSIVGATSSNLVVKTAGTYVVEINSVQGCVVQSADTTISVNPTPIAQITGDTAFCITDSTLLTASLGSGFSYQWYQNGFLLSGATGANYFAKSAGAYQVEITNTSSCVGVSDSFAVQAAPLVQVDSITGPTSVAAAIQYTYSVPQKPGRQYDWAIQNGFIISGQGTNAVQVIWSQVNQGRIWSIQSNGYCADSTELMVLVNLSVDEWGADEKLNIYPNPATSRVTLELPTTLTNDVLTIEVVDYLGRVKHQDIIAQGANKAEFSVEDWPSGVYIVQCVEWGTNYQLIVQ